MNESLLNLARTWRSRTFDTIIGQDLATRLIRNSLYRNQLFPVYLLAGQRGCGKTTLGRVFAAAINCFQRDAFTKQPRDVSLPCLSCVSCQAMQAGSHPDFHEIDAASHTGVDHVRELIESASFLPAIGTKKVYLIDEAHMLSKAAFSAFLKILEEPPASVIFLLATTDPHKILDTVRSRCFQLFLGPIPTVILQKHLVRICMQEGIRYDENALFLIAHESSGSARDAINRLEHVWLACGDIKYDDVVAVLGEMSSECLIKLCVVLAGSGLSETIAYIENIELKKFSAMRVWRSMLGLIRRLIAMHAGVTLEEQVVSGKSVEELKQLFPLQKLVQILEIWHHDELLFLKTQEQHILLESLLLRMNQISVCDCPVPRSTASLSTQPPALERLPSQERSESVTRSKASSQEHLERIELECVGNVMNKPSSQNAQNNGWGGFLGGVAKKDDPLVLSLFKQAHYIDYVDHVVTVDFDQRHAFFRELLDQTRSVWQPILEEFFNDKTASLVARFEGDHGTAPVITQVATRAEIVKKPEQGVKSGRLVDSKGSEQLKKVATVTRVFAGTVTEEQGSGS